MNEGQEKNLTKEEIDLYILNFTEEAMPICNNCYCEAEYYDQEEAENYCRECLEKSLQKDIEVVRELINE